MQNEAGNLPSHHSARHFVNLLSLHFEPDGKLKIMKLKYLTTSVINRTCTIVRDGYNADISALTLSNYALISLQIDASCHRLVS